MIFQFGLTQTRYLSDMIQGELLLIFNNRGFFLIYEKVDGLFQNENYSLLRQSKNNSL